ncbi:glucose-6-phosphate dehydrogenase [Mycobacterium sp.]|uniref:glucose-6-phosphate dehydrogenase n=1 Tax=Mycobacterium sp. TaxID=1785 RepID=UPI0025CE85B7|nr:glucose-6-phosphate dehydrogenase [Mycobacterium sp.]
MTSTPQVFVLFGARGDLARRKLFPGLYRLAKAGRLPEDYVVIGSGRHAPDSDDEFRDSVRSALDEFVDDVDDAIAEEFLGRLSFTASSADDGSDLAEAVRAARDRLGDESRTLIYLSVPPDAMQPMIGMLAEQDLTSDARVVVEKPFGTDLESSRELDAALKEVLSEEQIFRIDHFLGKEAVQNILALRFANDGVIEPLWNSTHLESVQIDVPESGGIEGRGAFYESTGCFRDMISTHLAQVLGFIAMEPPASLDSVAVRDEVARVFAALQPFDPDRTVFGQYDGYRAEDDVSDESTVETFVALEAVVDTERWRGTPFYLRTGKGLADTRRTVTLTFRGQKTSYFGDEARNPNKLVLELSDSPSVQFGLNAKRPGPELDVMGVHMLLDVAEQDPEDTPLEAYERLLLDVMRGDQLLFTRADEVDRIWQVCQPILDAPPQTIPYDQGTWGPDEAGTLPGPSGWHLPDE